MSDYEVGQRVWVYSLSRRDREPIECRVEKVGRTLVTVSDGRQYRMETGHWNHDFGSNYWIKTDERRAADESRAKAAQRLISVGVRFDRGADRLTAEVLEDLVAVLDRHGIGGES